MKTTLRSLSALPLHVLLAAALIACGGTPTPPGNGPADPAVTGVVVSPDEAAVNVGATVTLSATVQGDAGVSQNVTWSSSDNGIATVNNSGVVTGVAPGTATITATSQANTNVSSQARVTVTAPTATVDCSTAQELSADISADTTLPLDCHRVTTNITVSAALTLLPGTVLQFETSSGLRVADGGSLRAEGTAANPIRLTSASGDPNDWRGVGIFTSSSNNVFDHVTLENAGRTFSTINGSNATNLYLDDNARVAITNSTFRNSGGVGLYVNAANSELTSFSNNTFDGNSTAAMRVTSQQLGSIGSGNVFGTNALPGAQHIQVAATTLRTSATWPAADVPYRFDGNHFIDDSEATITIEAGATLQFTNSAGFRLDAGALRALGSSGAPVTFTSASGNPNDWRGLGIASSSAENTLEHVVIENAGQTFSTINGSNATNLYLAGNSRLAVTNSTFRASGGHGVYVDADSAVLSTFDDNEFIENTDAPIRLYSNQLDSIGSGNVFGTDAPFGSRYVEVRDTTITTDQTWQNLDVPYRFFGNHFINDPAATVTIEPGTTLQFDDAGLRVDAGALQAIGTAADRITFTSASGSSGGWRGVGINSSSNANALRFVTLENAGQTFSTINNSRSTNLYVSSAGVIAATDSAFNNSSGWGIYNDGAITDAAGAPIDPATQGNNTFSGNSSGDVGP
jgi:hypothetical protein